MSTDTHSLSQLLQDFSADDIKLLAKPLNPHALTVHCELCGEHHSQPAQHIQYVGHAALTKRLLEVDPFWNWQPLASNSDGTPRFDAYGGLWIELTICGMTRLGYGHPDGKVGGNAIKETIGDALRNAAMRFGAALSLWHKAELPAATNTHTPTGPETVALIDPLKIDNPDYPQNLFERNLPDWQSLISSGKHSSSIRHKLETTYTLTDSQLATLAALDGATTHANG